MTNYQQKLHQLDGRQQELVRDNHELKDLCLYLDEERNCVDLSCPHCGQKILSRPNSVVPPEDEDHMTRKFLNHKSIYFWTLIERFETLHFLESQSDDLEKFNLWVNFSAIWNYWVFMNV